MTLFRPCIDLHEGKVKQIVGGTLSDTAGGLKTNFTSEHGASHYAEQYRSDRLVGGHVIKLGPGNDAAAREALAAYPGGLQLGGGITPENAAFWLEAGASHVIATSCLFDTGGRFQEERLDALVKAVGRERLVLDLSCRRRGDTWIVAMNRWQTLTDLPLTREALHSLSGACAELLIHAADVEGRCEGIDLELVRFLGKHAQVPTTYAGGAKSMEDLALVSEESGGRVDLAIGSALDIFGGKLIRYADCVAWNRRESGKSG